MYKYSHHTSTFLTEDKTICLHDCKATQILLKENVLSFYFPNGFDVIENNGSYKKVYYTDEAQAEFPLLYSADASIIIYIFTEKHKKTIRKECMTEDFINQINQKHYQLEFLDCYIGCQTFRFICWLWFDEKPYYKECELILSAEKAIYQWNNIYEEKF